MKTSDKGLALIKSFEGFSARPYLCPAGVPTIGYGATYYPDGRRVTMQDKPVTEADATAMLRSMLASYEAGVSRYVLVPLTQGQFDALVSFAYNLGLSALKSSTLLRLVNARDWQGAAVVGDKMFMTTYKEGSSKVNYLYTLGNTRSELTRWVII